MQGSLQSEPSQSIEASRIVGLDAGEKIIMDSVINTSIEGIEVHQPRVCSQTKPYATNGFPESISRIRQNSMLSEYESQFASMPSVISGQTFQ